MHLSSPTCTCVMKFINNEMSMSNKRADEEMAEDKSRQTMSRPTLVMKIETVWCVYQQNVCLVIHFLVYGMYCLC